MGWTLHQGVKPSTRGYYYPEEWSLMWADIRESGEWSNRLASLDDRTVQLAALIEAIQNHPNGALLGRSIYVREY